MAAWSDFVRLVSPEAAGCADIVIEDAARRAAIEFCEKSLCHQRWLAAIDTVAGQSRYLVVAAPRQDDSAVYESGIYAGVGLVAEDEAIERLLSANIAGRPVTLAAAHYLDGLTQQPSGRPDFVSLAGPSAIDIWPVPNVAGLRIELRAAMRPSRQSVELDNNIFERHADAIADGAVARICATPNRAYTDPNKAAESRMRFQEAIDAAREGAFRSHTRTNVARMKAL